MDVLILGCGGREHALAAAVSKSPKLGKLFAAPGNAGTARVAENIEADLADIKGLVRIATDRGIDLTIVGPEAPLCAGLVDRFIASGLKVFGPTQSAARIEGDKAYAKKLMRRALVPTAEARIFDDFDAARTYIATRDCALVVKAAGLAAGKGVVVCDEPSEAILAAERMMVDGRFGEAGATVVVEERLVGSEISAFALVDGQTIYSLDTAQDYKRIGDGNTGPNTGGMGAISPAPAVSDALLAQLEREVFVPVIDTMRSEGVDYRGVLYAGVMLTAAGPKVLEFNCRFGDPEAQVILPRIESDVLDMLLACCEGRLADQDIRFDRSTAVTVVMASAGYPGKYESGRAITGIERAQRTGAEVFLAGVVDGPDGLVTGGGRVLAVTGKGATAEEARARAYDGVECIRFEGAYTRRDIGARESIDARFR